MSAKLLRNCLATSVIRILFVAIISGKYNFGSGKAWKTRGIFFSYFVATLKVAEVSGKLNICGGMYLEMI